MYPDFYNLKEKPFNLIPSSRFLYLGEVHKEALALLTYGVTECKGFTLLTGEVGTGKTTMIHALLANLSQDTQYVHLSNPLLSEKDFMNYLAFSVFKKKVGFKSKTAFLIEFEAFLKTCLQHQKNFILIIDEAHKLSFELLEEIRLLSNMETADEKLINIFLAGQPELNEKLSDPKCRALLQRISTRYHIDPLDLRSTGEYISRRLKMAGAEDGNKIFSKGVVRAIYHYSKGYPRVINILADNALLIGYARGTRKIIPSMVKECYEDLQLDGSFQKSSDTKTEQSETREKKGLPQSNRWKWAAVLLFLITISAIVLIHYGKHFFQQLPASTHLSRQTSSDIIYGQRLQTKRIIEKNMEAAVKNNLLETKPVSLGKTPETELEEQENISLIKLEELENPERNSAQIPWEETVIVKEGETLLELAANVYGRSDASILNLLQQHNPKLKDIDFIEVGQKIVFPALTASDQGPTFTVHIGSYKPFENARKLFLELLEQGDEAYIIPVHSTQKGKVFRITLGNFKTAQEAEYYAKEIMSNKVSDYAKVIQLEMK